MPSELSDRVAEDFAHISPRGDQTLHTLAEVERGAELLGLLLAESCPEGRELDEALSRLQEAAMWARQAVLRHQPPERTGPIVEASRIDEATARAMRDGKIPRLEEP